MVESVILSKTKQPRNRDLERSLNQFVGKWLSSVGVFLGLDGQSIDLVGNSLISDSGNKSVLGRSLTSPEIACLIGHRQIHNRFQTEWLLVIEDDAKAIDLSLLDKVLSQLHTIDSSNPTVISLFGGTNVIPLNPMRKIQEDLSLVRLAVPSTGTVSYLINSKARKLSISTPVITGVADWPTWIYKCDFYLTSPAVFTTLESTLSYISTSMPVTYQRVIPKYKNGLIHALAEIRNLELVKHFGGRRRYIEINVLPIFLRALSKLLRNSTLK